MEKETGLEGSQDSPERALAPPTYSTTTAIRPQARKLYDRDVTFEEYYYYAQKTRKEQAGYTVPKSNWREILLRKKPAYTVGDSVPDELDAKGDSVNVAHGENHHHPNDFNISNRDNRMTISDKEWTDASRALRTASYAAIFFLVTTDILGPFGVGFALGTLGWGPGIVLYIVFGLTAAYSGYIIWYQFLGLDSFEFPVRNYGDLAFRCWGPIFRNILNAVQTLGLLLILGQVTLQQAQGISQVSKFRLCYAVCNIVFIGAGFVLGQIRTLRNYGWVANLAIWLNLLVIFISMGVIGNSPPNYAIATLGSAGSAVDPTTIKQLPNGAYPPVMHYNGLPPNGLVGSINGLLSGVLAYAGAQLYCEFLAEMRRPQDFIKSLFMATTFIITVYLVYGAFCYHFQGQYAFSVSYIGVSKYGWQVVGDMLALLSGLIAAALYGNIGIKVLYNQFLMPYLKAPPLNTKWGRVNWTILVPVYWSIAFVIAASIPDYFGFVSVMSAATLLPLTYAFPPLLALGYDVQYNAMKADASNGFDPATGVVTRKATGIKRWIVGYFYGGVFSLGFLKNVWHTIYALGALALSGLGLWAAIEGLKAAFELPQFNAFTCKSPLNLNG